MRLYADIRSNEIHRVIPSSGKKRLRNLTLYILFSFGNSYYYYILQVYKL